MSPLNGLTLDKIEGDLLLVKLAREIAINHHEVPELLLRYAVSLDTWEQLKNNSRFQQLLNDEVVAWQSATNTSERVRLKAQAMVEEWLPEANTQLHNTSQPLNQRVELSKIITQIAGLAVRPGDGASVGEKFTVNINLGGQRLSIQKDLTPSGNIDRDNAQDL